MAATLHDCDSLFRAHRDVAFRVAYRLLGNECDALDAVQDGFVNALTHMGRFRAQSSFRTWLLRIVSNAALDIGRSRKRRENRFRGSRTDDLLPVPDKCHAADFGMERADLRKQLNAALAELPEAQRQTFVLHVDGELSYREVAEVLGISIGTVMSRLFYARLKLRDALMTSGVAP
jgi:RNA polymerase sigma-70 factor (ECF subfamily)